MNAFRTALGWSETYATVVRRLEAAGAVDELHRLRGMSQPELDLLVLLERGAGSVYPHVPHGGGHAGCTGCGSRMTADPWVRVGKALESGNRTRRADVAALHAEVARSRILLDPDMSFRDLEMHMRDGTINIKTVFSDESRPATRFLAALLFHIILGDHNDDAVEPENYMSVEMAFTPREEWRPIRCSMEVVKPGGKSSHEIRRELEAELATFRSEAEAS